MTKPEKAKVLDSRQIEIWKSEKVVHLGDQVPSVGLADSYSIRLGESRYVRVRENSLVALEESEPAGGSAIFDPSGKYLGRGDSGEFEPIPSKPRPMVEFSQPKSSSDKVREHTFWLRDGFRISLKIPTNFSKTEAERLSLFVQLLPFGD